MRKIGYLFLIIFLLTNCSTDTNKENDEQDNDSQPEGQLLNIDISAPSLENNLFEDQTVQSIFVYLPPSYNSSENRYPVVYFLHGFSTPASSFTNGSFQGFRLKESMDTLINNGSINEMIVVIPSGRGFMLGSFYVNSSVRGNWEDYIINDLVSYIDSNYRTLPDAASRGIAGHSMGGFGALNLAMLHPDIFSATYGICPGLFDEDGLANTSMFARQETIEEYLEKEEEFEAMSYDEALREFKSFISELIILGNNERVFSYAYGAAFSPNPNKNAPFIDYPYYRSGDTLVLDAVAWENYENGFGNLAEKVRFYKDNLLSLTSINIDYGINDFYTWIPQGCEYFSQLLQGEGIPHNSTGFNGGHSDKVRDRIENYMLPTFSNILQFDLF